MGQSIGGYILIPATDKHEFAHLIPQAVQTFGLPSGVDYALAQLQQPGEDMVLYKDGDNPITGDAAPDPEALDA